MATKEVMVSAPLMVLLFDVVFVSRTFSRAWRLHRSLHAALFSTWLLLAALVLNTGTRGGTAGFGINVTPWAYALTQFQAVVHYVWLSLWPHPLIFDYGVQWVRTVAEVLPYAAALLSLIAATVVAWRRWPMAAWLGTLFFAVLSPTSSFVPGNRQTLAEHRMYLPLPLAAVVVLIVCAVYRCAHNRPRRLVVAAGAAALGLGLLTVSGIGITAASLPFIKIPRPNARTTVSRGTIWARHWPNRAVMPTRCRNMKLRCS